MSVRSSDSYSDQFILQKKIVVKNGRIITQTYLKIGNFQHFSVKIVILYFSKSFHSFIVNSRKSCDAEQWHEILILLTPNYAADCTRNFQNSKQWQHK